mgnify:CR=1 FL=1
MQNEKIAIIALVIIIAGALSAFFVATYWDDLIPNPPVDKGGISYGDCVDINYIGRYASNNTIFDSSYTDPENKTAGTPLKIFVSEDQTALPPSGYSNYSAGIIDGLITRLIGLEEGESKSLGPIPPSEAYGEKLDVGDTFSSSSFALNTINPQLSLNQTLEVTSMTNNNMSLKWVDLDSLGKFTMPQIVLGDLQATNQNDMIIIPPPYFIWQNASEITNTADEYVTVKTTPTDTENLFSSLELIQYGFEQDDVFATFPDVTTFSYNETSISMTTDPAIGSTYEYSYSYFGQVMVMYYTVENKTEDTIGLSIAMQGTNETQNQTVQRSLTFNRTYQLTRLYKNIPGQYQESLLGPDIQQAGYSLNKLAGESLIFDVTVENLYKTSESN